MKYSVALFVFSSVLFAQRLPGPAVSGFWAGPPSGNAAISHPASTFGSNTGWGSVVNPGTGHPPNVTTGGFPKTSYYGRGSGIGSGRGYGHGGYYTGSFVYAYPIYIPGYYDSITANPYDQVQYSPQPPIDAYQGYPGAPSQPTVVIQNFYPAPGSPPNGNQAPVAPPMPESADPNMQTYRAPAGDSTQGAVVANNYFLIAMKDRHVYSVLAYWIEGNTFHYVTTQNMHNQAPLDSLDVDLTKRLNSDPNMNITNSGR